MIRTQIRLPWRTALAVATLPVAAALGETIAGVQPAALDQPRINAYFSYTAGGAPLTADLFGIPSFNVEAFFDTGASGILLSNNTADLLGIQRATHPAVGGQPIVYSDVGVAGSDQFNVSEPLHLSLAPYHPDAAVDDLATYASTYSQRFGPIRTQIGPITAEPDPALGDLDIIGTPAMTGKVVVMDPKPVDTFFDTMRTYVYNPGTPYNSNAAATDPGIPNVSRHVKLSYADFGAFTTIDPAGAPGPSQANNPFIGKNPVLNDPNDTTRPIELKLGSTTKTGSFLFDTGAAATIISKSKAQELGVTYDPATVGTDNPILLGVPLDQQFQLTIGGIGGTFKAAGFFLSSLKLPTIEGQADSTKDLLFTDAPVLVGDVTVHDPLTNRDLTLDGIFGMNNLVASAFVTESVPFPVIGALTTGHFDWITFDQPNGVLGLEPKTSTTTFDGLEWFNFGDSDWDIGSTITWFDGATFKTFSDGDRVTFDDAGVFANHVTITEPVTPGSVTIDTATVNFVFNGQAIRGYTGLTKKGASTVTFNNINTYTGPTDVQGGRVIFNARQNIGPVNIHSGATVEMNASQTFEALNIGDGGTATLAAGHNKVISLRALEILGSGRLDLTDNALVLDYPVGPVGSLRAAIHAYVNSARNGYDASVISKWDGPGLASSTARAANLVAVFDLYSLGVINNADQADPSIGNPAYTRFAGENVDPSTILVRYTYSGDGNLDGKVDSDDYALIDNAFNRLIPNFGWLSGDFNYDGNIDGDDYALIDAGFLFQGAPLTSTSAVPEPSGVLAVTAVALGLLGRRRRSGR